MYYVIDVYNFTQLQKETNNIVILNKNNYLSSAQLKLHIHTTTPMPNNSHPV